MNEKYADINRKDFHSTCASLVTGGILARIHEKYGNRENKKESKEAA